MRITNEIYQTALDMQENMYQKERLYQKLCKHFEVEYKGYLFTPMISLHPNLELFVETILDNTVRDRESKFEYHITPLDDSILVCEPHLETDLLLTKHNIAKYVSDEFIKELSIEPDFE